MKKIVLTVIGLMSFAFASAQEEGKFRVGLDLGYAIPASGGGGVLLSFEPKYNIKDNMNVGLRLGMAAMAKNISYTNGIETAAEIGANSSYIGTYEYYFKGNSSFVPYLGAGAGIYNLAKVEYSSTSTTNTITNLDAKSKFGALVRGGFEWGKFRMGLEYNIVPDSNLNDVLGNKTGSAKNSYLGVHLGFFIGGGKWGR